MCCYHQVLELSLLLKHKHFHLCHYMIDPGMFIGEELNSSGEDRAKTVLQGNTPLRNVVPGFVS